jgi:hypothetical protein
MGRYEIILGKKSSKPQRMMSVDTGTGPDTSAVSLWVNGSVFTVADSPDDVIARIDDRLVMVESVDGVRGEVVLVETPKMGDIIKIEYYYNKERCLKHIDVFDALPNPIYYVSIVPMVKCATVPKLELRSVYCEDRTLICVKKSDIMSNDSVSISRGAMLSVAADGRLCIGAGQFVGEVIDVQGNDLTIRLDATPTPSPYDALPFGNETPYDALPFGNETNDDDLPF